MKMLSTSLHTKILVFFATLFAGWSCYAQPPECTTLSLPADGATDVAVDTDLEWPAAANVDGYRLTIGRLPGGNDVLDDFDVGDVTTFNPDGNLPPLRTLYVTIVTYNISSVNTSCAETSFTTTTGGLPRCTEIINPSDGAVLVPYNQNITWIRDFNATSYFMTIREGDPNGAYLMNMVDVGNGTNFKPPDFKERTIYYVTMIPFNDEGPAVDCQPIIFTTGDGPSLPDCAALSFPLNNATGVAVDVGLAWDAVSNSDGYSITVGTRAGGTDIVDNEDVGNATSFQFANDLPIGTRIYVQVKSYANGLESEICPAFSFVVEAPTSETLKEDIPQFFTPNNDGFNDNWVVNSTENISVQRVAIFDRFGKLLKELAPGQGWNGTFNGQRLPSDSYWYELELLNGPNLQGYFLLKR